jgi:DNA-binding NtrC family response regulator
MTVERVGGAQPCRVDTRVVAATNRGLRNMVERRLFREDLFYRLAGVELRVPPLRVRREDIPLLVSHFLDAHAHTVRASIDVAALEALVAYDWPGNVRQLARVLERALAFAEGPTIRVSDLPPEIYRDYSGLFEANNLHDQSLRSWSSRYVRIVLDRCKGNKRRACEVLDISYHTLQAYLEYRGSGGDRPDALTTTRVS